MIKFFRHIRKTLLSKPPERDSSVRQPDGVIPAGAGGKTSKYLTYAIGEILLVVIGILIALQINNWNENRKANAMANQYLAGIKDDLTKDLVIIDSILTMNAKSISLISSIDSVFHRKKGFLADQFPFFFFNPDTTEVMRLFFRETSFRSIKGSYKSLIADGKSGLIKNKDLFQAIQQVYDENQERLASTYESIKTLELEIRMKYSFEKLNWTYSDLKNAKGEKIFSDLVNLTEEKFFYNANLTRVRDNSENVIRMIDKELGHD